MFPTNGSSVIDFDCGAVKEAESRNNNMNMNNEPVACSALLCAALLGAAGLAAMRQHVYVSSQQPAHSEFGTL